MLWYRWKKCKNVDYIVHPVYDIIKYAFGANVLFKVYNNDTYISRIIRTSDGPTIIRLQQLK